MIVISKIYEWLPICEGLCWSPGSHAFRIRVRFTHEKRFAVVVRRNGRIWHSTPPIVFQLSSELVLFWRRWFRMATNSIGKRENQKIPVVLIGLVGSNVESEEDDSVFREWSAWEYKRNGNFKTTILLKKCMYVVRGLSVLWQKCRQVCRGLRSENRVDKISGTGSQLEKGYLETENSFVKGARGEKIDGEGRKMTDWMGRAAQTKYIVLMGKRENEMGPLLNNFIVGTGSPLNSHWRDWTLSESSPLLSQQPLFYRVELGARRIRSRHLPHFWWPAQFFSPELLLSSSSLVSNSE